MKWKSAQQFGRVAAPAVLLGLLVSSPVFAETGKSDPAEQAYEQGMKLYREKNYPAAIEALTNALHADPNHAGALYNLGRIYDGRGRAKEAREVLKRLTKIDPAHADGWYLLGLLAEKGNSLKEAADCYRMAIAAKPDLVDAHYNLGFLYLSSERREDAAKQFKEVLRLNPGYAEAHMNLGVIYTAQGKLDEAEKEYESAITLKPMLAEAHYNLGVFFELHRKDVGRALAQYRKYLELGGTDERVERIIRQLGAGQGGVRRQGAGK
ncbi:MAG: tetratricopeptide repeat protein [Nitrospiraceae bacterium]